MREQFDLVLERLGGKSRALIIGAGLAATLLIFFVSRWATAPTWVPAFQNVPIEAVGVVTEKLDQAGVKYHLEKGGTEVQVAASDLAHARVLVAKGGGMPNAGRPGLELFDQPSWGMTDFTQKVNYRRALEGELERTIGKMRGIETAQVHLALLESTSFRTADRQSEASVVLKLNNGASPTPDVVQGIAHLVASSVDGLTSDHVTVVDDGGRLLSTSNDASPEGLSSRQLGVQREVETYLQTKAEQMVSQIVGLKNARVQVAAAINFDRVERTTQAVDPNQQITTQEQKSEITPGAQGGAASSNTATTFENTRSLETFSGAIGNIKRLTVAVLVNDKIVGTGDSAKIVPRSGAELERINQLVRGAVGLDSIRGDHISVVSIPFDGALAKTVTPKMDALQLTQTYWRPAITLLGLILTFIVALSVIKALKNPPPQMMLSSAADGSSMLVAGEDPGKLIAAIAPKEIVPIINTEMRDRVIAHVDQDAEVAAKLLRAWLKEAV